MKAMNGFDIFEKLTNVNDKFIEESAEMPGPASAAAKASRWERFSHFINSGWGVAMICGIVAVGVMAGILAASRAGGPEMPPISSGEQPTEVAPTDTDAEQESLLPEGYYITTRSPNRDHHASLAPWLTSAMDIGFDLEGAAYVEPALVGTTKTTPFGVFTYLETVGYSEELVAQGAMDNRVDRYENEKATVYYNRVDGKLCFFKLSDFDDIPDLDTPLTEAECTEMVQAFLEANVSATVLSALEANDPSYVSKDYSLTGYDGYHYYYEQIHLGYRAPTYIIIDILPTKGIIETFSLGGGEATVEPFTELKASEAEINAAEQQMWIFLEDLQLDSFGRYDQPYLKVNAYGEVYLQLQFKAYDNDKSDDGDWMTEAEETGSTDRKDTEVDINIFIDYDTRIRYSVYIKIT